MKKLIDSIQEKLVITKDTKEKDNKFDIFFFLLLMDYKDSKKLNDIKELYKLYLNDCDHIIEKNFDGQLISTNFELMFMLAAMIVDDDKSSAAIYTIGTRAYGGKNNPYDFSWFEEENSRGQTILEVMSSLYTVNDYFKDTFKLIYLIIEKCCTDKNKQ